jgi:hypothetical protein
VDQDYALWVVDATDGGVTRTISRALASSIAQPDLGRRCRALLVEAGFVEVEVQVETLVYTEYLDVAPALAAFAEVALAAHAISDEERTGWLTDLEQRGRRGVFFLALPFFIATARAAP